MSGWNWAVTVSRDGEEIVTIESNSLSGREIGPEDEKAIRMAAQHLLAFIGHPPAPEPPSSEHRIHRLREVTVADRNPVMTVDDILSLDVAEISEGYFAGFHGEPEPGNNRSRSYRHGWRNGACDGGHIPKDDAMAVLAHAAAPNGVLDKRLIESSRPALNAGGKGG